MPRRRVYWSLLSNQRAVTPLSNIRELKVRHFRTELKSLKILGQFNFSSSLFYISILHFTSFSLLKNVGVLLALELNRENAVK